MSPHCIVPTIFSGNSITGPLYDATNHRQRTFPLGTAMSSIDIDEKERLILASETAMARQLALHVIERPVPRVWMIFIPILFVLYFSKVKIFESSLKDFAEHYLIPRRMILKVVLAAKKSDQPVDIEKLIEQLGNLDVATRALCMDWLTVLVRHFQLLLAAQGDNYSALVRSCYPSRENYLQFCDQLCTVESAVNQALLSAIDGNDSDLHHATKMMDEGVRNLRRQEAGAIFS